MTSLACCGAWLSDFVLYPLDAEIDLNRNRVYLICGFDLLISIYREQNTNNNY